MRLFALTISLAFAIIPLQAEQHAFVKIPVSCMRTQPRHSAEQSSQAILGTPLTILSQSGGWSKILTPDGYTGYMKSNTIEPVNDTSFASWQRSDRVICKVMFSPLEQADGSAAGYMTYGSILTRNGSESPTHLGVTLPDGRDVWVKTTDVWPDTDAWTASFSTSDKAHTVITTAISMTGAPYLWGGTSSLAPDCSGFTQIAYSSAGLLLPRDTSMQIKCGVPVKSLADAKPGDLIFYGQDGRVNHVAIYLGDKKIIHSSGSVRICRMDNTVSGQEELFAETPMCIRRILGENGHSISGVQDISTSELYFGNHTLQTDEILRNNK